MSNYIERYWRDAKPEDAIKEPPMVGRFRQEDEGWVKCSLLYGYDRTREYRWSTKWSNSIGDEFPQCFKHCQVYDAPDPGEGWRLIDTANEKPKDGDEYYNRHGEWVVRAMPLSAWTGVDTYRRRITPTVTYVPFTWEDREQLRGRWIKSKHPGSAEFLISKLYNSDKHGLMANDYSASSLLDEAIFFDTGKPVGKEVTQ